MLSQLISRATLQNYYLVILSVLSTYIFGVVPALAQDSCANAWKQSQPARRYESAIAFDSDRQVLVMFGGETEVGQDTKTWEWDGSRWELKDSGGETSPAGRSDPRMVYDPKRKQTILFGGYGTSNNETWTWNGSHWTKLSPLTSPPARYAQGMVYDSAREVIVMFGGYVFGSGESSDTWEWDGTNWAQITTANTPVGRRGAGMSYDLARGKVVLFGGYIGSGDAVDTWEYDGKNWNQITPSVSPTSGSRLAMAYDIARERSVLFTWQYSYAEPHYRPETWEWDGTTWSQQTPSDTPGARDWPTMVYDTKRGEVLLFSGYDYSGEGKTADIWYWKGADTSRTWEKVSEIPQARMYGQMVYDSARAVAVLQGGGYYGGYAYNTFFYGETWENNGSGWVKKNPAHPGPKVGSHSMVYDSKRGVAVLFGGGDSYGFYNDTWEWDGDDWTKRSPAHSPGARSDAAMAFDQERGVVVLFGGNGLDGYSRKDVWEWDGIDWKDRTPSQTQAQPAERMYAAMTYDPTLKAVILYGGMLWPQDFSVWAWNGVSWIEYPTNGVNPGIRERHSMVYDVGLGQILLFGGDNGNQNYSSVWGWNGTVWRDLGLGGIDARTSFSMAYHEATRKTILFGGSVGGIRAASDTWELSTSDTDGDGTMDCADGCPLDAGKTSPGVCGCGVVDKDNDKDGIYACNGDLCDNDAAKLTPGICGCGVKDLDTDGDGTMDCMDECPMNPGKVLAGVCSCSAPDNDSDLDGTMDCVDGCPSDKNKITAGVCGCGVKDIDSDNDGTMDCLDLCPLDSKKVAGGICGCGTADVDSDQDGTMDCVDSCPLDKNKIAVGVCGCGVKDIDSDGDGTMDCADGCPADPGKTSAGVCGCGTPDVDSNGNGSVDCVEPQVVECVNVNTASIKASMVKAAKQQQSVFSKVAQQYSRKFGSTKKIKKLIAAVKSITTSSLNAVAGLPDEAKTNCLPAELCVRTSDKVSIDIFTNNTSIMYKNSTSLLKSFKDARSKAMVKKLKLQVEASYKAGMTEAAKMPNERYSC